MLQFVSERYRIPWDIHPIQDIWTTSRNINIYPITTSKEMLEIMLSNNRFRMFKENGSIGYGFGDADKVTGMTEQEAYSEWLDYIKLKERQLKKQLPLVELTQTQFDALMGMFIGVGKWRRIPSDEGIYDVERAVKEKRWKLVADMIANCNVKGLDSRARLNEARVLMLGDYAVDKDRGWLRVEGVQHTRTKYVSGDLTESQKRQAEYAYYRQTGGGFLPNMAESRKRKVQIVSG